MQQTKKKSQIISSGPSTDHPLIDYNGEDDLFYLNIFLHRIENEGKKHNFSCIDYAACVAEHLKGNAKKEYVKKHNYMFMSFEEIKYTLRKRWIIRERFISPETRLSEYLI